MNRDVYILELTVREKDAQMFYLKVAAVTCSECLTFTGFSSY